MDSHLVAVKVGVKGGAYQRMQLDGTAFGQDRLESLNAQSVQSRCTVQQYRMFLDYLFQNVPHRVGSTLYHALSTLNVSCFTAVYQTLHNEGFEQLQSHFLRQAALIHLQLRADDDNGTAGVVNTLAQQVLTETALLALEHIGQGLQGAVAGPVTGGRGGRCRSGRPPLPAAYASRCGR